MAASFKPGNRFSDVVSVAAAAVEWQGLNSDQQRVVAIEDGLPYLDGVPDLTQRAEALLEAAERRAIEGYTHTEDGEPLSAAQMRLYRDSVDAWVAKARKRLPPELPSHHEAVAAAGQEDTLLRVETVVERLGISRTSLYRWQREGRIDKPHAEHPPRWRSSYILTLIGREPEGEDI